MTNVDSQRIKEIRDNTKAMAEAFGRIADTLAEALELYVSTQTETQNSNLTFKTLEYCDICDHKGCEECIANALDEHCMPSQFNKQIEDECAKEYEELGLKELKELIEADRKTEPTISKMEQVDKDINVRSKTENNSEKPNNCEEPQYEMGMGTLKCDNCSEYGSFKCTKCDGEMYFKRLEPKDEPQTEKGGCTNCDGKDLCNNAFTEISQYCGAYEPQNGYQTFNGTSVYVSRLEDEPQTDCPWK